MVPSAVFDYKKEVFDYKTEVFGTTEGKTFMENMGRAMVEGHREGLCDMPH